jgi:tetratricopeptide (TPR) repeat protein
VVEQLTQYAAVALFIQCALDARPDFAVTNANAPAVAEICARLDGLPLAIELAAARVKLLPPQQLLKRLERRLPLLTGGAQDLLERQQTMRATLAWSEDLLSPADRVLFRRLAVFVGSCTLEAAEAVCAAPEEADPLGMDVLDGLGRLVDQSLVQQHEEAGEARFSMLHVIREYALERLEASGEAEALHRAHLAHFLALVEPVNHREVFGPQGTYWLGRLEREHDNLRGALAWARTSGAVDLGLRLAVGAAGYWYARGDDREARQWLELLLAARPADQGSDTTSVWALIWAGCFAGNMGDLERGVTLLEQALAGARPIGETSAVAIALQALGALVIALGDNTRGAALLDESLVEARRLHDVDWKLVALAQGADWLLQVPGQESRALALAEETLEMAQREGKQFYEAYARRVLAFGALQRGNVAEAEAQVVRALRLARDQGLTGEVMRYCVETAALVTGRKGQAETCARLLGAATALQEAQGLVAYPQWRAAVEAMVAPAREALGKAQWAAAFAAGQALSLEEAIAEALDDESTG